MSKIYNSITDLIGNTPIVKLNHFAPENGADIYVKVESFNPGSSVKDRIALAMIEAAEKNGQLKPGDTIIEPTSGNTGIGLSMVGAAKGYKVIIVMPDTMSIERRKLMQAYGAKLILTPGSEGIKGSIDKATDIDGTLVDDAKNLSPKTIEVLKKARANGIYVVLWLIPSFTFWLMCHFLDNSEIQDILDRIIPIAD